MTSESIRTSIHNLKRHISDIRRGADRLTRSDRETITRCNDRIAELRRLLPSEKPAPTPKPKSISPTLEDALAKIRLHLGNKNEG